METFRSVLKFDGNLKDHVKLQELNTSVCQEGAMEQEVEQKPRLRRGPPEARPATQAGYTTSKGVPNFHRTCIYAPSPSPIALHYTPPPP